MIAKEITSELKKRFTDELKRSSIDGKERAIPLCIDQKNKLANNADTCVGTKCDVTPGECPKGTFRVGNFHIHPLIKDIRDSLRKPLIRKYGHIPSDDIVFRHVKNLDEAKRNESDLSHKDAVHALYYSCLNRVNYTECVGTDIMPDSINCFEVEKDLSEEDCAKIAGEMAESVIVGERIADKEWMRKYFKTEKIDISKYRK